jgi:hypothetical protein
VHPQQGAGEGGLGGEVAIGHGVQAVAGGAGEPQRGGSARAIDGQAGARQGPGPQRGLVGPAGGVQEATAIAAQHLGVGHEVMAQGHHLRALQVGVAGQQGLGVLTGAPAQRQPRPVDGGDQLGAGRPGVELQIGGHLVVAAASGVQAPAGLAHQLGQPGLDVHVDVLQAGGQRQLAALDLRGHGIQAASDGLGLVLGHQTHRGQHAGVGLAAAYVITQQPAVEVDAGVQGRSGGIHGAGEAGAAATGRGRGGGRAHLPAGYTALLKAQCAAGDGR